ncbi:MAG TPA: hypothetical protein VFA26_23825 [Gemmataceae bacterium]|nr:hypothetical protein [Gemmataceae bacterium]
MRAWVSALGKPLLCVIACPDGATGFVFVDDESPWAEVALELMPGGVVVGVQTDGGPVRS